MLLGTLSQAVFLPATTVVASIQMSCLFLCASSFRASCNSPRGTLGIMMIIMIGCRREADYVCAIDCRRIASLLRVMGAACGAAAGAAAASGPVQWALPQAGECVLSVKRP